MTLDEALGIDYNRNPGTCECRIPGDFSCLPRKDIKKLDATTDKSDGELQDEPLYVISVAARLAGLPSWTLRVLDKEGIVRPQRTAKDRRLYSDRDIARLARVRYLTEERGVNMAGVKLIFEMEHQTTTKGMTD